MLLCGLNVTQVAFARSFQESKWSGAHRRISFLSPRSQFSSLSFCEVLLIGHRSSVAIVALHDSSSLNIGMHGLARQSKTPKAATSSRVGHYRQRSQHFLSPRACAHKYVAHRGLNTLSRSPWPVRDACSTVHNVHKRGRYKEARSHAQIERFSESFNLNAAAKLPAVECTCVKPKF